MTRTEETTPTPRLNHEARDFLINVPTNVDYSQISAEQLRAVFNTYTMSDSIPRPEVNENLLKIPCYSDGHNIKVTVYRPKSAKMDDILPAFVYLPGGGFTLPAADSHTYLCKKIACETPCAVFLVHYAVSPETKFPVAPNECFSVVKFVSSTENAKELYVDPARVAVGGDSSGGCLTASTTLLAKERGLEHNLKFQILYYPCLDPSMKSKSYQQYEDGYFLTKGMMQFFINNYKRNDKDLLDKIAFPHNATVEEVTGLPPALVMTGEADILRDEGEEYVNKLLDANVPVTSYRVQGAVHGFITVGAIHSLQTLQSIDLTTTSLRRVFY